MKVQARVKRDTLRGIVPAGWCSIREAARIARCSYRWAWELAVRRGVWRARLRAGPGSGWLVKLAPDGAPEVQR